MSVLDKIRDWIEEVEETVKDLPAEAKDVVEKVKAAPGWLGHAIEAAFKSFLISLLTELEDVFASLASLCAQAGFTAGATVLYPIANMFASLLKSVMESCPTTWIPFVDSYMESVTGKRLSIPPGGSISIDGLSSQFTEAFAREVFSNLLSTFMPTQEEITRNPFIVAERFLSYNFRFQMDSWMLHMLGELISFGQFKAIKDLPLNMSWALGLGWLSWILFSVPFRVVGVTPMEWHLNYTYRQNLPSPSQLIDMYLADMIDEEELDYYLGAQGYQPYFIERLTRLSETRLSDTEVRKLYEDKVITEQDVEEYIRLKGYPDEYRPYKKSLIIHDRLRSLRDKFLDEVLDLYIEGGIPEGVLRGFYEKQGYTRKETDLIVAIAEIRKKRKSQPTLAQIRAALKKKYITHTEARRLLIERGWDSKWAEIVLRI